MNFLSKEYVKELGASLGYTVKSAKPVIAQAKSQNFMTKITSFSASESAFTQPKRLFVGHLTVCSSSRVGADLILSDISGATTVTNTFSDGIGEASTRIVFFNSIKLNAGTRDWQFIGWMLEIS